MNVIEKFHNLDRPANSPHSHYTLDGTDKLTLKIQNCDKYVCIRVHSSFTFYFVANHLRNHLKFIVKLSNEMFISADRLQDKYLLVFRFTTHLH